MRLPTSREQANGDIDSHCVLPLFITSVFETLAQISLSAALGNNASESPRQQESQDRMCHLQASHSPLAAKRNNSKVFYPSRIRGVKCDEQKPSCHRCNSTGRKCDGYRSAQRSIVVEDWIPENHSHHLIIPSPERALSDMVTSSKEKRMMECFRTQVAPMILCSLDSSSWSGLILRIAHAEPAVRYAVIAAGSFFERVRENRCVLSVSRLSFADDEHRFAIQCYSKAIAATRIRISSVDSAGEVEVPLLTCVLFTCIEFLQGNTTKALSLCNQGRTMIQSLPESCCNSFEKTPRLSSRLSIIKEYCKPILGRLNALSAIFGCFFCLSSSSIPISAPNSASSIQTVADARVVLYALMYKSQKFLRTAMLHRFRQAPEVSTLRALQAEQDGLLHALQSWQQQTSQLEAKCDKWSEDANACGVLHMYCSSMSIWIAETPNGSESALDDDLPDFQSMIHRATALFAAPSSASPGSGRTGTFAFEMELIPPLYFTAIKCRHPRLRRDAISLLQRCLQHSLRRKSVWGAVVTAAVAERVIPLEEKALASKVERGKDLGCWPKELRRFHDVVVGPKEIGAWNVLFDGETKNIRRCSSLGD